MSQRCLYVVYTFCEYQMNLKYHVLADPLSDQVLAGPVLLSITFRVDGEPFEISDPTLVAKH